jgi:nucleotide sugar dehydrogenase
MMVTLDKDDFITGKYGIGVWGVGFIGATTAMAYASEGVRVTCYDINSDNVRGINMGKTAVTNLEFWFGATMTEFVEKGLIRATTDVKAMADENIKVHFVCIPTERDAEPWNEALIDVLERLKAIGPPLVIIESTLTPGTLDSLDLGGLAVGVSPRRDWFHSPEKNLKNLPRIYGGMSREIACNMREILSVVVDNLVEASNHRVAELVKSVENSLLHVPAVYATQLAHAYPDLDIGEVLRLAATHWRIPAYYPSLGTGGYCIPLSSKYVKKGAARPEYLTILDSAIASDVVEPLFMARRVAEIQKKGAVGILGVSYKGDLKVHVLSPAIPIIDYLRRKTSLTVRVHDPYYAPREVRDLFGVEWFSLNGDLALFDVIIMVTDHKIFRRYPAQKLLETLKSGALIVDNYGIWAHYRKYFLEKGIRYYKIGDPGWTLDDVSAGKPAVPAMCL